MLKWISLRYSIVDHFFCRPIQSACCIVFKKNMTLFDNCLINKAESQDLNISQLEFTAKEKGGLFKEMCFKAENVFL